MMPENKNKRLIAIHLPQFHPIPENDEWWGKGFTEWTNVTKARPRFRGHYQPHLPADMGFYDLRLPEVREAQANLAKKYGIYGFCYYHYWFNGKRMLHRPLDDILSTGKPDFPFCLCWANENWTRRWDGKDEEVLIKQEYNKNDYSAHIEFLINIFKDDRYIKIEGKPFFAIYRTDLIPDIGELVSVFRNKAKQAGFPDIYLTRFENVGKDHIPTEIGFDAAVEFQPNWKFLPNRIIPNKLERGINKILGLNNPYIKNQIFSYKKYVGLMIKQQKKKKPYKCFPGITPNWDNSARRKENAFIFIDSTPSLFRSWLEQIFKNFKPYSEEENFIFINAWNEWAEGNHLEPCQKWGRQYLEAVRAALEKNQSKPE